MCECALSGPLIFTIKASCRNLQYAIAPTPTHLQPRLYNPDILLAYPSSIFCMYICMCVWTHPIACLRVSLARWNQRIVQVKKYRADDRCRKSSSVRRASFANPILMLLVGRRHDSVMVVVVVVGAANAVGRSSAYCC